MRLVLAILPSVPHETLTFLGAGSVFTTSASKAGPLEVNLLPSQDLLKGAEGLRFLANHTLSISHIGRAWLHIVPSVREARELGLFGDWRTKPMNRKRPSGIK